MTESKAKQSKPKISTESVEDKKKHLEDVVFDECVYIPYDSSLISNKYINYKAIIGLFALFKKSNVYRMDLILHESEVEIYTGLKLNSMIKYLNKLRSLKVINYCDERKAYIFDEFDTLCLSPSSVKKLLSTKNRNSSKFYLHLLTLNDNDNILTLKDISNFIGLSYKSNRNLSSIRDIIREMLEYNMILAERINRNYVRYKIDNSI